MNKLRGGPKAETTTTTTTTTETTRPVRRTAGRNEKTTSGGLFGRRRGAATQPRVHNKRKTSLKDKISGGMLKLKGDVEGKPGVKAAGTRRMHGTDGRGIHRRRNLL